MSFFPRVGKNIPVFSKHWKTFRLFFQNASTKEAAEAGCSRRRAVLFLRTGNCMKWVIPWLVAGWLAAVPCRGQDVFFVEDKPGDAAFSGEDAEGLDLVRITFSRKGSSRIEIDFRMKDTIPRTPKGDYMIIAYLDFDTPAGEDPSLAETTADLNVLAFKVPGYANWECRVDKAFGSLAKETFQIVKFNQHRNGFSIDLSSPVFKDPIRIGGYAEWIVEGKAVDRAPETASFTWQESNLLLRP